MKVVKVLVGLGILFAIAAACSGDDGSSGPGGLSGDGPVLVVNTVADTEERDDQITLREALLLVTGQLAKSELNGGEREQVDGDPGVASNDTIVFDEVIFSAEEPGIIALDSVLPALSTGGDSLDGRGGVIIDGRDKSFTCLTLASDGNRLKRLQIQGCHTAVLVEVGVSGNLVGEPDEGNVLSGNLVGVELRGQGNTIAGNIIGLNAAGTAAFANEFEGIWVTGGASGNVIGGAGPGEGNVISGNDLFGVSIDGATGTVLQGNIFGLDLSGLTAVANKYGIIVQSGAGETLIGGEDAEARNIIAGNGSGIVVRGEDTEGNTILGNYIGTDVSGEQAVGNIVDLWFVVGRDVNILGENHSLVPLNLKEGGP